MTDAQLKPYINELGNINLKSLCLTGEDFFVAPYELDEVRNGTMKFKPIWEPYEWPGTAIVGLLWMIGTILATTAALAAVGLVRWVWGRP